MGQESALYDLRPAEVPEDDLGLILEDVAHLLQLPDAAFQPAVELFPLALEVAVSEGVPGGDLDLLNVDGLREEVECAQPDGLHRGIEGVESAEDDPDRPRTLHLSPAHEPEAVEAGHHEVRDDEVDRLPREDLPGGDSILRLMNSPRLQMFEAGPHQLAVDRLILDDEDRGPSVAPEIAHGCPS